MAKATRKTSKDNKAPQAAEPVAIAPDVTQPQGILLRKKDFVERVAALAGVKKSVARDVSDAVLQALGEALDSGDGVALAPLGKLRVTRRTDREGAGVVHLKLKRAVPGASAGAEKKDEKTAADPLAEGAE